jgi:hypothetical protein
VHGLVEVGCALGVYRDEPDAGQVVVGQLVSIDSLARLALDLGRERLGQGEVFADELQRGRKTIRRPAQTGNDDTFAKALIV